MDNQQEISEVNASKNYKTEKINEQLVTNKIQKCPEDHCLKVKIERKLKDPFVIQCFQQKCDVAPKKFIKNFIRYPKKLEKIQKAMQFFRGNDHFHYLSFEMLTENEFTKSENQYLEVAGQLKGPFNIFCLKCAVLSKNYFEFKRHLEIHNINVPPYECFCNYKTEKDHFNSFLSHYNDKLCEIDPNNPISASEFKGFCKNMLGKPICMEPVGCFVEVYDVKSPIELKTENKFEEVECNNNVKNETDMN